MLWHSVTAQNQLQPTNNTQAVASNPANGVNNIPLSSGTDAPGAATAPQAGNQPDQNIEHALNILDQISRSGPQQAIEYKNALEEIYNSSSNPLFKPKFATLLAALPATADGARQTKDPLTGESDPTAAELAKKLAEEIRTTMKNAPDDQQQAQPQQAQQPVVASYNVFAAKKKKKHDSRGNPFRVLMGQVGKLLDHGMEKSDIVRYLDKKGMFNKETIEKAVDIVRDYNRKLRKDDKESGDEVDGKMSKELQPETEEDISERLSAIAKAFGVRISEAHPEEVVLPGGRSNLFRSQFAQSGMEDGSPQYTPADDKAIDSVMADLKEQSEEGDKKSKASNVYNAMTARMAAKTVDIYEVKPQYEKRSTAELMSRAVFLSDLLGFNSDSRHNEGRKAADVTGAKAELKAIRSALTTRGYDEQEIKFNLDTDD